MSSSPQAPSTSSDWLSALQTKSTTDSSSDDYVLIDDPYSRVTLLQQALGEVEAQRDESLAICKDLTNQLRAVTGLLKTILDQPRLAVFLKDVPYLGNHVGGYQENKDGSASPAWLRSSWLECGGNLAAAEGAYHAREGGKAFLLLDLLVRTPECSIEDRIDAKLLQAKIVELIDLKKAYARIIDAEKLATCNGMFKLRRKALFHKGMNCFKRGQYKEARLTFAGAKGAVGYEQEIEAWIQLTEVQMNTVGTEW